MMNKNKKIAMAVVSTVMAGTMMLSFAACGPNDGNGGKGDKIPGDPTSRNLLELPDGYDVVNDTTGDINYSSYERSNVTLNLAVGHEKLINSTSFRELGDEITLPDNNTYTDGQLKPAWQTMSNELHIGFNDVWDGTKTSENLSKILSSQTENRYSNVDIFTSDLSKVVDQAGSTSFLNLADYLDYMPHYAAFLNQNPVVYLSLLQDGMKTTGDKAGEGKTLYVAPYFDGMDDIERYCLIRQDWTEKLLNSDTETTGSTAFNVSCQQYESGTTNLRYNGVKVEPFMAGTGTMEVESANKTGTGKITIVKNYGNVLTQIKTDNTPLDTAYRAIAGTAYTGDSGNIVAIQNAALTVNPAATGAQLLTLFRVYIDACYQVDGQKYYAANERANLFNGYDACWDADDLVAMLRCILTNKSALGVKDGNDIGGITAREGNNNRTPDLLRLGGQLYGVRGTASANEYMYIDSNGDLHDARNDDEFYEVSVRMNQLFQEGLILDCTASFDFNAKSSIAQSANTKSKKPVECFMEYDYSQTQTEYNFYMQGDMISGAPAYLDTVGTFKFAAIATPVSKWDVDGDGNHTDVMRFTESWRTVKTSGLALNGALANNPEKLKAALQFIDYLYSEDGQIVSTYGPMATNANGDGGFWYNEPAAADAEKYFTYKGVKYSGTEYKGRITPTVTTKVLQSFMKKEVNGWKVTDTSSVNGAGLSFTNYARYLIGSTLPVGVKDQSFESQLTSKAGKVGSDKVGVLLDLGVIKGMSLDMESGNLWYTCVPSGLPVSDEDQQQILNQAAYTNYKKFFGTSKSAMGIMPWIICYGTSSTFNSDGVTLVYSSISDLRNKSVDNDAPSIKSLSATREAVYADAWETAKSYWNYLKPAADAE
ncbi:MAG: hypothetical protein K2O89_06745 [Clostridia bacterium]|nr:hypothetical protein [Clostridia bacterium]